MIQQREKPSLQFENIDTNYIRVAVTDPFGDYDIRDLDFVIRDPEGNPVVSETLDDSFLVNWNARW